ncbi:Dephospho-CoA kinase [bacterium HR36]|nr:Dephospho-CoA kinase [bacterium HR36]
MDKASGQSKPLVIGLIGGIGSGKSLVGRLLGEMGGYLIEADKLGHEALRQPQIRQQLVQRWGQEILNPQGEIDRARLAEIVFSQPQERRALEAIVHPYITDRLHQELQQALANPTVRLVVIDAALLLEAGWHRVCDKIVFVDAPAELRQARTQQSRGWSAAQWQAREAAQWPVEEKRRFADALIVNAGDIAALRRQLQDLLAKWFATDGHENPLPPPTGGVL